MDHSCHKCGHNVEDGKPFCSQCGAPQIRVMLPEAAPELTPAEVGATPGPNPGVTPFFPPVPAAALPTGWSQTTRSCVLAAGIAVALAFVGLSPFVGAIGAGFMAVAFFRRRSLGTVVRTGAGARLGALSGLLFFSASTIIETLAVVFLHKGAEIRTQMMEKVQQAAARYPGPEVQPFLDFVKSPRGFAFMMVASLIFGCLAFVVLGSLGGSVGALFFGRNDRP
jgi:hypothetical protein